MKIKNISIGQILTVSSTIIHHGDSSGGFNIRPGTPCTVVWILGDVVMVRGHNSGHPIMIMASALKKIK